MAEPSSSVQGDEQISYLNIQQSEVVSESFKLEICCVLRESVSELLFIYLFCFADGSLLEQKKSPQSISFLEPSNQISQKESQRMHFNELPSSQANMRWGTVPPLLVATKEKGDKVAL